MKISAEDISRILGWQLTKAGKKLISQNCLCEFESFEKHAQGIILEGQKRQVCQIFWVGKNLIEGKCTCPTARRNDGLCQHVAALVVASSDWEPTEKKSSDPKPITTLQSEPTTKIPPQELRLRPVEIHLAPIRELPKHWKRLQVMVQLRTLKGSPICAPSDSADARLAQWLVNQGFDPTNPPAILALIPRLRQSFFAAIAGHPRIFSEKNAILSTAEPARWQLEILPQFPEPIAKIRIPELHSSPENGMLLSDAQNEHKMLLTCLKNSDFDEEKQFQLSSFPAQNPKFPASWPENLTAALLEGKTIPVPIIAILNALDFLQENFLIDESWLNPTRLEVHHPEPIAKIRIGGGNERIDALADLDYGEFGTQSINDQEIKISFKQKNSKLWQANALASHQLQKLLISAGFEWKDKRWQLTQNIANFLLDVLPSWQKSKIPNFPFNLQVLVGQKLDFYSKQLERVEPRVHLSASEANGWFEANFEFSTSSNERWTPSQIQRLLASGKRQFRTPSGKIAVLKEQDCLDLNEWIAGQSQNSYTGLKISAREALTLQHWQAQTPNFFQQNPNAKKLLEQKINTLPITLRNYQKEGVSWLIERLMTGGGALLADDMGLGKTIQSLLSLDVLSHLLPEAKDRPNLVVMPASLLENWKEECEKFFPHLDVHILHGSKRDDIPSKGLLLTTYALVSRDLARHIKANYFMVILDEASLIRNPDTDAARALRKIPAQLRLALTGTPVENRISDLWSIMEFSLPGYLGPREIFRDTIERPLQEKSAPKNILRRLKLRVFPWILRRMKDEVARELPPKMEFIHWCELNSQQKNLYHKILDQSGDEIRKLQKAGGQARMLMLTTLLRLRQLCDDPRLLGQNDLGVGDQAKVCRALELIDELTANGHKVLVFSQFASMLKLMEAELLKMNISSLRLDGSTNNRNELITQFREPNGPPVFFISLKAGGYGLNLQAADAVIHLDPWWNPAVENQATDRAYRIGQTRPVQVYKLITKGTVEEKILALQKRKAGLLGSIIAPDEDSISTGLSQEELNELLS